VSLLEGQDNLGLFPSERKRIGNAAPELVLNRVDCLGQTTPSERWQRR
jgi:hypothetical protein